MGGVVGRVLIVFLKATRRTVSFIILFAHISLMNTLSTRLLERLLASSRCGRLNITLNMLLIQCTTFDSKFTCIKKYIFEREKGMLQKADSEPIVAKPYSLAEELRENRRKSKSQKERHPLDGKRLYLPGSQESKDAVAKIEELMRESPLVTGIELEFTKNDVKIEFRKKGETISYFTYLFPHYPAKFPTEPECADFVSLFLYDCARDIGVSFAHAHPEFRLTGESKRSPRVWVCGNQLTLNW